MPEHQPARRRVSSVTVLLGLFSVAVIAIAGAVSAAVVTQNQKPPAQAAPAAPNPNCTLIVPANPLTAQGLASPFQLTATNAGNGPCNEANANQSAYVQAAIIDGNGQINLYSPLVVDKGTQPAAAPVVPTIAAGSTVALWFGFNGTNLTLQGAAGNTLGGANCVNGLNGSVFGQFADCNAAAWFRAANAAIAAKKLTVPPVGTAKDGKPCPTTRDFSVVDQDQSDNVTTHYLSVGNGQIAQFNAANKAKFPNATDLFNGSDNLLLTGFVDPTLGCTPWMKPDLSAGGTMLSALPLDELSAAANQKAPIALVPLTDPMTLVNNAASNTKTNLYRSGVNQPPLSNANNGNGTTYCQNIFVNPAGIQRVFNDMAIFANGASPTPAMANNLFTFLATRGNQSFTNLNCGNLLKMANPIALTATNGITTAAKFTPQAAGGAAGATPTATATGAAGATPTATPTGTAATPTGTAAAPTPAPTPSRRRGWRHW